MSTDSINQLAQAKGLDVVTDWHPPIMVGVWSMLIMVTGKVSSFLLLQLGVLWFGLCLLSLYVFGITKSKIASILPFLAGLLPFVLNISGVIWKDTQMAFSLMLASVLILLLAESKWGKYVRYTILGIIILLITYACLVRYNALLAAIPIIFIALRYGLSTMKVRMTISLTVLVCFWVSGVNILINNIMNVRPAYPISAVMFDDIVNSLSIQQSEGLPVDSDLNYIISNASVNCSNKRLSFNSISYCTDNFSNVQISMKYHDQIKDAWMYTLTNYPVSYVQYKAHAFIVFLFSPDERAYYWQNGINKNVVGQAVKYEHLGWAVETYVKDFGYKHFSFFYHPWFWLVLSGMVLWYARTLQRFRLFVVALSLSSVIYIITYLPVVIATDYRYIYWSVIAVLVSIIILVTEKYYINKEARRGHE